MIGSPFLTEIDPRAEVKGSRDPLGLVPLWSRFGRHVVGNLTTITGSVRGFTTTLLGYYFARQVREKSPEIPALTAFLKFEQLAAYSRLHRGDAEFRGVQRAKRRLAAGDAIHLSALPADQILSNQKVYGLWGLFTVPARAGGLLEHDELVLAPEATAFVEKHYVQALTKAGFRDGQEIVELLRARRPELRLEQRHKALAAVLARLHAAEYSDDERAFYWRHLAEGGPLDRTAGQQRLAAELLRSLPAAEAFDRAQLRELLKSARRRGHEGAALVERLGRIDHLESVLVPAEEMFAFVLGQRQEHPSDAARTLAGEWGRLNFIDLDAVHRLKDEIAQGFDDSAAGERWMKFAEALVKGEHERAIGLLLDHNAAVMYARNGAAPWVRLNKGRLDVRVLSETRRLRPKEDLATAWVNNYFLNPLKQVVDTLREA